MTVTITPDSGQSKVYGTTDPVLTFANDGGLPPEAFTSALSRDPGEDVGTYAITPGDLSTGTNYSLVLSATPVTFEITKATATLALVTADLTQTVGSTMPVGFTVNPTTLAPDVTVTYTGIDPTVYGPSTTPPTEAGSYDVAASLTNANYTALPASGTLVINPPVMSSATLTLSLIEGSPLATVSIRGDGFVSREYVQLRWDAVDGPIVRTVRVSNQGSFSVNMTIPRDASAGSHDVVAIGLTSSRMAIAVFTVTIPATTLTLSVTEGRPLASVTVTGEGFMSQEYVQLRWDAVDGPVVRTVRASSQGTFLTSTTIPADAPAGLHEVVAIGLDSNRSAIAQFMVTIPATTLTLSPTEGPSRTSVSVYGDGFMPREYVQVRWNGIDGQVIRTVRASSQGTFSFSFRVDRNVSPRIYHITAVGSTSDRMATAPFTVTSPVNGIRVP